MASTCLRFQNSNVFQIIDRHAYRAITGEPYTLHSTTPTTKRMAVYFQYLDALHFLAASSGQTWVQASLDCKQRLQQLFPEGIAYDGQSVQSNCRNGTTFRLGAVRER